MLLRDVLPSGVVDSRGLTRLERGTRVTVVGLVVARQRPQTAKGVVFMLIEEEGGMINVIIRPEIYDRDRVTIRGEPFVWVAGRLAKDDGTLNVIAEEVRALKVGRRAGYPSPDVRPPAEVSRSPFALLRGVRRNAPEPKSWG